MTRFDRNVRMFGADGQRRLRKAHVAIVGVGGLGSHVAQQLALLGVGAITLVDNEQISTSNKNRYVGVRADDPVPGTFKVKVASRLIQSIDSSISVSAIAANVLSSAAFKGVRHADYIFGCLDHDGPRFVLNDIATAYGKYYVDLASDVIGACFGGRVLFKTKRAGCLFCLDELNQEEIRLYLESPEDRINRNSVYGIDSKHLDRIGPSVVSVNGAIASLAVTEFMLACTSMAKPKLFIDYRGEKARAVERRFAPRDSCPYCQQWGIGDKADIDRYLRTRFAGNNYLSTPCIAV